MREALAGIGGVKVALLGGERMGVVVEPTGIGADPVDRVDLADVAAAGGILVVLAILRATTR
jgi:hypothetical protein